MRSNWMLFVVLGMTAAAYAKDPKPYQTGNVQQMDSVQCDIADSGLKEAKQPLCQEYVLQSDEVTYRIRPRDQKNPVLLPVGERAQFRLQKNKMLLRVPDLDGKDFNNKEREYIVVSMAPRSDSSTADATPVRLNHLQ
jgi:hypothetical protein